VLGTRQNRELRVRQEAEQFDGTFRSHDIAIAADHQSRRGTRAAVAEAQEVCAIDAEMFEQCDRVVGGLLKIGYDLILYTSFRHVRPPEEELSAGA